MISMFAFNSWLCAKSEAERVLQLKLGLTTLGISEFIGVFLQAVVLWVPQLDNPDLPVQLTFRSVPSRHPT